MLSATPVPLPLSLSFSLTHTLSLSSSADLDDSTSSGDSFLGRAAAAVLVYRPTLGNAVNGILVALSDPLSTPRWYVFSVAHGAVSRRPNKADTEHRDIRLILLQPDTESLSLTLEDSFIELPWTRCFHTSSAHYAASGGGSARFTSDCSVFELQADRLSDVIQARAVQLFDWGGAHRPSSRALGVSLVRDEADRDIEKYMEIRIEDRVSAWSDMYVYLPSIMSAKGQSGTGLTDKKGRLVGIVSGNYTIGSKQVAVAVLARRHLQLLHQPAGVESFEPGDAAVLVEVAVAGASSSGSGKRGWGQQQEGDDHVVPSKDQKRS